MILLSTKIIKKQILFLLFVFIGVQLHAQTRNSNYNIVWNTQSKNSSESMPCGGGDIGMNVWMENGDVLIYVAKSGNFDENNALMKTGRLRIKLSPNVFEGQLFKQELHLQEGYVTVQGENKGVKATIKIWADVFSSVAHVDISANKKINVEAAYENWRYQDRIVKSRENFANSWKWAAPKNNVYKKDVIDFNGNEVLFYHHNIAETIFDATVKQQGMDAVKDQLYNPLARLAFGGSFSGRNFVPAGTYQGEYVNTDYKGWKLKSNTAAKEHALSLYLYNEQVNDIGNWKRSLDSLQSVVNTNSKLAAAKTQQWWQQFWNRSFIEINNADTTSKAWQVGRNFQLFRYMLAINAHGGWPTKFNGGLLTVDPVFTDTSNKLTPDYRNWGGGLHTAQNQRLVYFPTIKNGDWDLLQPQLNFYLRLLKNAELRSKVYWNHGGACFTEQMENYGLPDFAEYGQKRPDGYDKGMEYNAWLEYEWDTVFEFCLMMLEENEYTGKDISDKIPFIESCLQFFDEHYQYLAKQRGSKVLDGEGKLVLYPGSGGETFKMANNSTSTIAALQTITKWLLALPAQYLTEEKIKHWQSFLQKIPPVTLSRYSGKMIIAPAKTWERINNTEPTQLYTVFPWGTYGISKPDYDVALNTFLMDTNVIKFKSHIGWKQDNIFAARLGLTNDAWDLTSKKLQNSGRRFPAFWGPGFDWVPDHNWGGSGMIGLQEMLLQVDDKKIMLFAAWPKNIDVHFKLNAPYNTTVEAEVKNGKLVTIKVLPVERMKDVTVLLQ
ncbi:DUF5703 domain-containing protein [Ferruginibacter sp. SUN106]|uniref:DUF5703 domain-containing protein n=1 Tax=Ferruginibacter sp. SUN106 TaxID=2978348 RepID=UPI003D365738